MTRALEPVLSDIFQRLQQPIALLDDRGILLFANASCATLFPALCTIGTAHLDAHLNRLKPRASQPDRSTERYEISHDGDRFSVCVEPTADQYRMVSFENLGPREQRHTFRDLMTSLPDRTTINTALTDALDAPKQRREYALHLVDFDRLSEVYATIGYATGDRVLSRIVERIGRSVREGDVVAQIDTNRFAILQRAPDQPAAARTLATRLIEILSRTFLVDDHVVHLAANVGTTMLDDAVITAADALTHADMALREAKKAGQSCFRLFELDMNIRAQTRRALEADLRKALSGGQFSVNFQPEVTSVDNKIAGCEALLRWTHPGLGAISPALFIPIAEETGLINEIGEWVLNVACSEAATWKNDSFIAVNLSPVQFSNPNLVDSVARALKASGLPAHRLELEVTEGVLLRENATTLTTLRELRSLGVRIAIDDFGTGFSGLSYIRLFPFDKVKIDQSFIGAMMSDKSSSAIVRAIIGLGQSLDIVTTAEGVETREQFEFLRAEGCTQMQGYLISRPVCAGNLAAFKSAAARTGRDHSLRG